MGAPWDMIILELSGTTVLGPAFDSLLKMHDFTFVLRSNGRWAYAIVTEKDEEEIVFVVEGDGWTKTLARKHWAALIRLVDSNGARRSCGDSNQTRDVSYFC